MQLYTWGPFPLPDSSGQPHDLCQQVSDLCPNNFGKCLLSPTCGVVGRTWPPSVLLRDGGWPEASGLLSRFFLKNTTQKPYKSN